MARSTGPLEIHLLDMGVKKFGDCILCRRGDRTILIDGGRPGDQVSDGSMESIPDQIAAILGAPRPFRFDLLVVTHCHSDHIGCLPYLVKAGTITARRALVADEQLGYGHVSGEPSPDLLGLDDTQRRVLAALREEGALGALTDAAIRQLIADAADLETNYREMLAALAEQGTRITRFRGQKLTTLQREFREFGLEILGPSAAHLKICAREINRTQLRAAAALRRREDTDLAADEVALFRDLTAAPALGAVDALDASVRPGFALNNQSMILSLRAHGKSVLLTADMQFADPDIKALNTSMLALRKAVAARGPFNFGKIAHHGSHNAFDETVLKEFGARKLAISGGYGDPGHPERNVLQLLDTHRNSLSWWRTDRNGRISCRINSRGLKVTCTKGRPNDAQPNQDTLLMPGAEPSGATQVLVASGPGADPVEIIARIPNRRTRVTLTIDIDPAGETRVTSDPVAINLPPAAAAGLPKLALFGGRTLRDLVFVTDPTALAKNIGAAETAHVLEALTLHGCSVVRSNLAQEPPASAAAFVRERVSTMEGVRGVVLLGGYDVVPSLRLSTLSTDERSRLNKRNRAVDDPDDFVVWSDDAYGDHNGDGLPELPVSRVPDGQRAAFLYAQLSVDAAPQESGGRFGLRNFNRLFAEKVFQLLPGNQAPKVSHPITPLDLGRIASLPSNVYWMLHGADFDTSRFWGEYENGRTLEACNVSNLPKSFSGVALAGCCYGALIVEGKASSALGNTLPPAIPINRSFALTLLAAGANAFVGCTGAHYSPLDGELNHYGAPLHHAFWANVAAGLAPAAALHHAKMAYLPGIPHGPRGLVHVAIEKKVMFEFTCLGLGW